MVIDNAMENASVVQHAYLRCEDVGRRNRFQGLRFNVWARLNVEDKDLESGVP